MRGRSHRRQAGATMLGLLLVLLVNLVAPPARSSSTTDLITAVYYDTYLTDEPEEAIRLMNVSDSPVDLSGWTVTDGEGTIALESSLDARESIWIAREAASFALEFGFSPDYEYDAETAPAVPNLTQSGSFALANGGDEVTLKDDSAAEVSRKVVTVANYSESGSKRMSG